MAKYILFSVPSEPILEKIEPQVFYKSKLKVAYIPSDGSNPNNPKYARIWQDYINKNNAEFIMINNSLRGEAATQEIEKINKADVLILTGGNTFQFLQHLKESGMDKAITEFAQDKKIIVGFSAGAIILSQTIQIAQLPPADENVVGIQDLSGLGLIEFDVYPHYDESEHRAVVDTYEKNTGKRVVRLTDDEVFIASEEK